MKINFSDQQVSLRKAKMQDARYCYQLSQRNMSRYKADNRTYSKYKAEFFPSAVKIIEFKGRRFGYLEFQKKDNGWYLWDMQLSTVIQNKGLGTKLLEYVIQEVKKQEGKVLKLFVYENNPAIKLYEKFGFLVVKNKSTKKRLLMKKVLG